MEQRTEEWFAERLGKATASRMHDITAKTRSGYSASRANYKAQLVAERLTGTVQDSYSNAAMQWGIEKEPEARAAYAFLQGVEVEEVGFVNNKYIDMSGASPDGLVGDKGVVEIKCPNTATHIDFLQTGKVSDKYKKQMLWQMICCERLWCDFVSYDPRMPAEMQLFVQRYERDAEAVMELENEVKTFLSEVSATVEALQARYNG